MRLGVSTNNLSVPSPSLNVGLTGLLGHKRLQITLKGKGRKNRSRFNNYELGM